jgi:indolepyruvate ferredoxin oxidoreductase
VAVEANKTAFAWGRHAAHDPAAVRALAEPGQVIAFKPRETLDSLVARRSEFLAAYQDAAYAAQYRSFVERVRQAEAPLGRTGLAEEVARRLFQLMAYKDEYEVARLHADTGFVERVRGMFEGNFSLHYHLAPPLLARRNSRGELQKSRFGPWMLVAFRMLARLKGLRGTPFDPFGATAERRAERALIHAYRADVESLLGTLSVANHALALDIAHLPEQVKGYGHVKERNRAMMQARRAELLVRWSAPLAARQAA